METTSVVGYRVSPQQARLWALHEQGVSCVARCTIWIHGAIGTPAIRGAVELAVCRHEILRTTFRVHPRTGEPLQIVDDSPRVSWRVLERERAAPDVGEWSPAELARGPLVACTLVRHSPDNVELRVQMPALCADAETLKRLAADVLRASAGRILEEAPRQFADIAEWQNAMAESTEVAVATEYWRRVNTSAVGELRLPLEIPAPVQPPSGPASISRDLPRIGDAELLQACVHALVFRLTGRSEVVVGTVIDGRTFEELHGVCGPLSRVLPIQSHPRSVQPFADLVADIRRQTGEAREFQDGFLWDQTPGGRQAAERFAPVCFGFADCSTPDAIGDVSAAVTRLVVHPDRFKLGFFFTGMPEGLHLEVCYDPACFRSEDVETLTSELETLMEHAAAEPTARLGDLRLLSDSQERRILSALDRRSSAPLGFNRVDRLFEAQAARTPHSVAIMWHDETVTYGELDARANQVAHVLLRMGVKPDDLVAISLDRSPDMLVCLLGVLKAGGAYVPIDPSDPTARLDLIARDVQPKVWMTAQAHRHRLPAEGAAIACIDADREMFDRASSRRPTTKTSADQLAYVIYTSGTTGRPKGTMVTHAGLANYLQWSAGAYRIAEGDGSVVHSPLGFDLTVTSLLTPLVAGQAVILTPDDPGVQSLVHALRTGPDLSLVKITPSHLDALATELAGSESVHVRTIVVGGEALNAHVLGWWRGHAPRARIVNEYGPTETVVGCCVYEIAPDEVVPPLVPIGRPIANTDLYVLDRRMRPVPLGVAGELYIGGAGLARGYLNRPDLTADRFVPHPFASTPGQRLYRTGDGVRLRPDGQLEFLGRFDGQIKVRGYRIEPSEVESAILEHPQVHDAAVAVIGEGGDARLVAFIVMRNAAAVPARELRQFVAARLPGHMVPSAFVRVDTMPVGPNGKLDRAGLQQLPAANAAIRGQYVAPRSPVEESLARIWEEVLGIARVGAHDDFFELGGHSLAGMKVVARVRDRFQVELPLTSLFEAPTLAELAVVIVQRQARRADGDAFSRLLAEVEALPEDAVKSALVDTSAATERARID